MNDTIHLSWGKHRLSKQGGIEEESIKRTLRLSHKVRLFDVQYISCSNQLRSMSKPPSVNVNLASVFVFVLETDNV